MYFQRLFLSLFLFLILAFSDAQRLVSPTGRDCSATYDYSTSAFSNDCVSGVMYDDFYDLDLRCSCLCTQPWNYQFNHVCSNPRRHRLTCGFGGPRWFINCWNTSDTIYRRYEVVMRFAHRHLPINIKFNHTSLHISVSYYFNHTNSISGVDGILKNINADLKQPVSKLFKI